MKNSYYNVLTKTSNSVVSTVRRTQVKNQPLLGGRPTGRKTIIYVKKVHKRRRQKIIKCCGRNRCTVGPKRRNVTEVVRQKPGGVTTLVKATSMVKEGTTAAPAKGEEPGEETAAPTSAPDPTTAGTAGQ